MKRLITFLAISLMVFASAMAADDFDYVFLKNGSVVKGVITEQVENLSVTIRDTNGRTYTYPMVEVLRVTHGEGPVIPKGEKSADYKDYTLNNRGFWCAVEVGAGYSLNNRSCGNAMPVEMDVTVGYRFNDYLRVGVGAGVRGYGRNDKLRWRTCPFSYPMFANVRGNFIPSTYRTMVPYYSVSAGYAMRDGFMWTPTIGLRFGQMRNAFTLGLSYLGQNLYRLNANCDENGCNRYKKYTSFIMLRLGYEF